MRSRSRCRRAWRQGRDNGDHTVSFLFEHVLPQQFGDNIAATLYATCDGETVSVTKETYSVREYCMYQIEHSEDPRLVTLLSGLLLYGAQAQISAGYKTGALVTDGLTLTEASGLPSIGEEKNRLSITGEGENGLAFRGAGLRLENRMAIYLTFRAESLDGLTVVVTQREKTTVYDAGDLLLRDGVYVLYIHGIGASDFDEELTARFERDGAPVGQTLTYSVNSYLYAKQNSPDEALAALVRSVYSYGESMRKYAEASGK